MELIVLNFSHPLTAEHQQQITDAVQNDFHTRQDEYDRTFGEKHSYDFAISGIRVIDIPFQLDPQEPLYEQVKQIFADVEKQVYMEHNKAIDDMFVFDPNYNTYVNEWGTTTRYTSDGAKYTEPLILVNLPAMSMASAMMYQICTDADSSIGTRILGFIRMKTKPNNFITLYELAEIAKF